MNLNNIKTCVFNESLLCRKPKRLPLENGDHLLYCKCCLDSYFNEDIVECLKELCKQVKRSSPVSG